MRLPEAIATIREQLRSGDGLARDVVLAVPEASTAPYRERVHRRERVRLNLEVIRDLHAPCAFFPPGVAVRPSVRGRHRDHGGRAQLAPAVQAMPLPSVGWRPCDRDVPRMSTGGRDEIEGV